MATNKRKDAAALFELIEKSTLKVPKGGNGALKIPSWWSSKVNPPTVPHSHESEETAPAAPEARDTKFPEPLTPDVDPFEKLRTEHATKPEPVDPTAKPPKESLPVDLPPTAQPQAEESGEPQKELNWEELPLPAPGEPEPEEAHTASEAPRVSESSSSPISHPVSSIPATSIPRSGYSAPAPTPPTRSTPAYRPPVAVPPTTRLAAPSYTSSYNAARAGQSQNFIVMMLEAPLWVKASFCTAILVLIGLVVALVTTPSKSQRSVTPPPAASAVETPRVVAPAKPTVTPDVIPDSPPPPPSRVGKVVPANAVQRRGDKYYLVLSSLRSQNAANDIAKFTAENGVDDVTVERHQDRGSDGRIYNNFKVISVEGVTKLDRDAEAMRMRFVEVGRKHPESKQFHKGIFDDAYFARVTRGK